MITMDTYFIDEMELTDKIIKRYAEENNCNEAESAKNFKLTMARITAEMLNDIYDKLDEIGGGLTELSSITDAINPTIHNPISKRKRNCMHVCE